MPCYQPGQQPKVDGLRVGFLSVKNYFDRTAWSGTIHWMYRELASRPEVDLICLGSPYIPTRTRRVFHRLWGSKGAPPREGSPADLRRGRAFASRVKRQLQTQPCDVIFAPVASWELAFVEVDCPIIYLSDITAKLHFKHYERFELSRTDIEFAHHWQREAGAISKATRLIYPSNWAAESAVSDYHTDRNKIDVIAFGANVDSIPQVDEIIPMPPVRNRISCRLLFIASNWLRKGGDVAVETLAALKGMGVESELVLVGNTPTTLESADGLQIEGFLNKNVADQRARLNDLFLRSHFIILPSRGDCSPMVIGEANAFGLPAICRNIGGIAELVSDGENGFTLPAAASGADFAALIAGVFNDPSRYERLVRTSRAEYDKRLTWQHWGDAVCRVMKQMNNDGGSKVDGLSSVR